MSTAETTTANLPVIFITTSRKGRRMAFRYSFHQFRSFRMPIAEAEMMIATGQAQLVDHNPNPFKVAK